jgi:hypothetical protein
MGRCLFEDSEDRREDGGRLNECLMYFT